MNDLIAEHRVRPIPAEIDMLANLLDSAHMFGLTADQVRGVRSLSRQFTEMLIDFWAAVDKAALSGHPDTSRGHVDENVDASIRGQIAACISRRQALHSELQSMLSPAQYRQALLGTYGPADSSTMAGRAPVPVPENRRAIETESAINAAEMLMSWAKLFASLVAVPAALLIGVLALIGIEKYSDFTELVRNSEKKLKETVEQATQSANKFSKQVTALEQGQVEAQRKLAEVSSEIRAVKDVLLLNTNMGADRRALVQREFDKFQTYLINLGYAPKEAKIAIEILKTNKSDALAYYQNGVIFVAEKAANDLDIIFREYLHHVLYSRRDIKSVGPEISALESGVADYLVASHAGSPRIYAKAFGTPVDLEKGGKIKPASGHEDRITLGRSWASLFYGLRQKLGSAVSDKLVLGAWFGLPAALPDNAAPENMIGNMLKSASLMHDIKTRAIIADLAKQHGAPVPPAM
jgi:hypothetical protein